MNEKTLKKKFENKVKSSYRNVAYWNIVQGPFSKGGFPDIWLCIDGKTGLFEAKKYGNRPTEKQMAAIQLLARSKANICVLTTNKDEDLFIFEKIIWHNNSLHTLFFQVGINSDDAEFRRTMDKVLWERTV